MVTPLPVLLLGGTYAIAFYGNVNDYELLQNVVHSGGRLWGIDQSFMVEFRYALDHMARQTENAAFREKLLAAKVAAEQALSTAIERKNYQTFIFQYDAELHRDLIALADTEAARTLLGELWTTKEIYGYYFSEQYYLNNEVRGRLMKSNFLRYYRQAQSDGEPQPKVLFKLGANHAARGLTRTYIYDISNLAAELAIMNESRSLHLYVMGIEGHQYLGNPFAEEPTVPFDNRDDFPQEIQDLLPDRPEKYVVIDLEPFRHEARDLSPEFKKFVFAYDAMILVRDCQALTAL